MLATSWESHKVTLFAVSIADRQSKIVLSSGNTPIYGLYGYVPRDKIWFLRFSILK